MPRLSAGQILFLAINAMIGLCVGTAAALSPEFAAVRIPTFVWLVVGMLLVELLAGLALKTHPSAIVTMPVRVAELITSFVVCYVMLGVLKAA
jgi:hypothetical protein